MPRFKVSDEDRIEGRVIYGEANSLSLTGGQIVVDVLGYDGSCVVMLPWPLCKDCDQLVGREVFVIGQAVDGIDLPNMAWQPATMLAANLWVKEDGSFRFPVENPIDRRHALPQVPRRWLPPTIVAVSRSSTKD